MKINSINFVTCKNSLRSTKLEDSSLDTNDWKMKLFSLYNKWPRSTLFCALSLVLVEHLAAMRRELRDGLGRQSPIILKTVL